MVFESSVRVGTGWVQTRNMMFMMVMALVVSFPKPPNDADALTLLVELLRRLCDMVFESLGWTTSADQGCN